MTTMPGLSPGTPQFSGPNPAHCLEQAGLTNVRPGVQNNTWIGNFGNTPPTDSTAVVLLTGPYGDADSAAKFASSLQSIPELATASGRWVASAAATSHLEFQVNNVAQCMGTS
jgi:hypothetical protein